MGIVKDKVLEIMSRQSVMFVTTYGAGGIPRTRAVLNTRNRELFPSLSAIKSHFGEDFSIFIQLPENFFPSSAESTDGAMFFYDSKSFRAVALRGRIFRLDEGAGRELALALTKFPISAADNGHAGNMFRLETENIRLYEQSRVLTEKV